jgi:hypothetical protein
MEKKSASHTATTCKDVSVRSREKNVGAKLHSSVLLLGRLTLAHKHYQNRTSDGNK